jgi:hypothetical protein
VGKQSIVSKSFQDIKNRSHEVRCNYSPKILCCGQIKFEWAVVFESSPSLAEFSETSPVEFPQSNMLPSFLFHRDSVPECNRSIANAQASGKARARRRFYGE